MKKMLGSLIALFLTGCNQAGIAEPATNCICVTPTPSVAPLPPAAILNIVPTPLSNPGIHFTFENPSKAEVEIDRRDTNGSGTFQKIADLPAGATTYDDLGLHSPWRYDYQFVSHLGSLVGKSTQLLNYFLNVASPTPTVAPTPTPVPSGGRPVLPPVSGNAVLVPNSGNLQGAINAAASGTKLVLSGNYSGAITLKSGVNLVGPATISGDIRGSNLTNVRLDSLTLNGTVTLDDTALNLSLTNSTFDAGKTNDLVFHAGNDIHIINNTFQNASDIALLGWVLKNSEVNYNLFQNSSEHLHLFWAASGTNVDNVKINHNIFRRSKRYTMELQGGPNTLEVAHNWIGDWLASDLTGNCLSTTMSIATGGSGPNTTSYNVIVHDNIVGYFPANPPVGSGCRNTGSAYELMGSNLDGWNNLEFGLWKGGPLTGWTTPAWKWHENIKIGSTLSSYPLPAGEDHYQAPAPGNYVNNKVLGDGAIPLPDMSWAYTNN
jgi:hypothetical protein